MRLRNRPLDRATSGFQVAHLNRMRRPTDVDDVPPRQDPVGVRADPFVGDVGIVTCQRHARD